LNLKRFFSLQHSISVFKGSSQLGTEIVTVAKFNLESRNLGLKHLDLNAVLIDDRAEIVDLLFVLCTVSFVIGGKFINNCLQFLTHSFLISKMLRDLSVMVFIGLIQICSMILEVYGHLFLKL
jgi:hypothetical protein